MESRSDKKKGSKPLWVTSSYWIHDFVIFSSKSNDLKLFVSPTQRNLVRVTNTSAYSTTGRSSAFCIMWPRKSCVIRHIISRWLVYESIIPIEGRTSIDHDSTHSSFSMLRWLVHESSHSKKKRQSIMTRIIHHFRCNCTIHSSFAHHWTESTRRTLIIHQTLRLHW